MIFVAKGEPLSSLLSRSSYNLDILNWSKGSEAFWLGYIVPGSSVPSLCAASWITLARYSHLPNLLVPQFSALAWVSVYFVKAIVVSHPLLELYLFWAIVLTHPPFQWYFSFSSDALPWLPNLSVADALCIWCRLHLLLHGCGLCACMASQVYIFMTIIDI